MITALSLVNFTTDEKARDYRGRDASEAFLRLDAARDLTAVQCQCHGSESASITSSSSLSLSSTQKEYNSRLNEAHKFTKESMPVLLLQ